MNGKLSRSIFWALVGVFIVLVGLIITPRPLFPGWIGSGLFLLIPGALFLSLGITFLVLTIKGKTKGISRKFQLLTGASAIGIPVSILLHNAIYGLFIHFFGAEFWNGGDEPVFFIMAIIVCPLAFLVGAIGSIILAIKNKQVEQSSQSI
ncbi:hypothetical protein ES703_20751 [subsurface metagenome]